MTKEQFKTLRNGDVILWKKGAARYFRTIVTGPADRDDNYPCVTLPIRKRSWTGRPYTIYGWNDIKDRIEYTGKRYTELLLNPEELERLVCAGFKVSKCLKRELKESRERPCQGMEKLQQDQSFKKRCIRTLEALKFGEL